MDQDQLLQAIPQHEAEGQHQSVPRGEFHSWQSPAALPVSCLLYLFVLSFLLRVSLFGLSFLLNANLFGLSFLLNTDLFGLSFDFFFFLNADFFLFFLNADFFLFS